MLWKKEQQIYLILTITFIVHDNLYKYNQLIIIQTTFRTSDPHIMSNMWNTLKSVVGSVAKKGESVALTNA